MCSYKSCIYCTFFAAKNLQSQDWPWSILSPEARGNHRLAAAIRRHLDSPCPTVLPATDRDIRSAASIPFALRVACADPQPWSGTETTGSARARRMDGGPSRATGWTRIGALNFLLSGLRLETEWTIRSGMVLFLTSEVLLPLFLVPIQPANPYSPIPQMPSRSSTLDLLSEYSLSR
jgi:hypothetical protein